MAKVKIQGHASGTGVLTVTAPNTSTDRTITLPDSTGTLVDSTTAVTKDASGNVGVGVTPKSWENNYTALQIGSEGCLAGHSAGNVYVAENVYRNSGNWKHINTGASTIYQAYDGKHVFKVAPSASADANISWATKVTIDNDGLKFGTDTASANALDDYEEGDWTPTLTGSGTINHRVGKYVKIGNQIMVQGEIRSTSYNNSGSTDIEIGGLPYSSLNVSNYNFAANITPVAGFNSNATQGIAGYVTPNTSKIRLYGVNFSAGANYDELQTGEMGTTVEVFFAVHYRTN